MTNKREGKDVISQESVIQAYRQLEAQASRMAAMAKQADWEALVNEEERYTGAVANLADMEEGVTLDEHENEAKYTLLENILDHDLNVRSRLIERREELSQLMAVSRRESALGRAYGKNGVMLVGEPPGSEKKQS